MTSRATIPAESQVVAVAGVLLRHADRDGRNCYPAIETIVRSAGVARRSARLALRWLVDGRWLVVTAMANQRRPTAYRLSIPEGAEEHPL